MAIIEGQVQMKEILMQVVYLKHHIIKEHLQAFYNASTIHWVVFLCLGKLYLPSQ